MKQWRRDPVPEALWRRYGLRNESVVRYQLIGQWIGCYERNEVQIRNKTKRIRRAQLLLGILVVCLVGTVLAIPYVR
jgi:hypothetical protein